MQDILLGSKKKVLSDPKLVLAMDFEGTTWTDSAQPSRVFTIYQPNGLPRLSTQYGSKNGTQSFVQDTYDNSNRGTLSTPIDTGLTFTGDFWIEWWTYFRGSDSFAGNRAIQWAYGLWTSGGSQGLQAATVDSGVLRFHDTNTNDSTYTSTHSVTFSVNTWYHCALGRSGTQLWLFVNGVPNTPVTWTSTLGVKTQPNFAIGGCFDSRLGSNNSYGTSALAMDRFRMYNGKCLHTTAFTPDVGLYPS